MSIQAIVDAQLNVVDKRFEEAKAAMIAYRANVAETKRLVRNYKAFTTTLTDTCVALQQRYRVINKNVRDTQPPAYFSEELQLPFNQDEYIDPELSTVENMEEFQIDVRQELASVANRASDVKHRIHNLYASYLEQMATDFAKIEESDGRVEKHFMTQPQH